MGFDKWEFLFSSNAIGGNTVQATWWQRIHVLLAFALSHLPLAHKNCGVQTTVNHRIFFLQGCEKFQWMTTNLTLFHSLTQQSVWFWLKDGQDMNLKVVFQPPCVDGAHVINVSFQYSHAFRQEMRWRRHVHGGRLWHCSLDGRIQILLLLHLTNLGRKAFFNKDIRLQTSSTNISAK